MSKIETQEKGNKIVAWQTKLFQKIPTERVTYYKDSQHREYEGLGGLSGDDYWFDTELEVLDKGKSYFYDNGEFVLTRNLIGYGLGVGPSYSLDNSYPNNKEVLKRNEKVIKSIEDIVGKTIINRTKRVLKGGLK